MNIMSLILAEHSRKGLFWEWQEQQEKVKSLYYRIELEFLDLLQLLSIVGTQVAMNASVFDMQSYSNSTVVMRNQTLNISSIFP